jgi:hypothetical protein
MTQRKITENELALIAALADPNTDPKTRSIAAKGLADIEVIQKKLALIKARNAFVNLIWPTFDHRIWPTPEVNLLSGPGRSAALRRP